MENVKFVNIEIQSDEIVTYAIIERGNGEYTSMPKSVYDEMIAQREHLTENPTEGDE
jgi:hypothetical protein